MKLNTVICTFLSPLKTAFLSNFNKKWLLFLFIVGIVAYVGAAWPNSTGEGLQDQLFQWTAPLNHLCHSSEKIGNYFLIVLGILTDVSIFLLLILFIKKPSLRVIIHLVLFYSIRGITIKMCQLPVPEDIFYHYPNFKTLSVNYGIKDDLFYSGHVGFSVLVLLESIRQRKLILSMMMFIIVISICFLLIVLRIHYTMDIFTGFIVSVALFFSIPKVEKFLKR